MSEVLNTAWYKNGAYKGTLSHSRAKRTSEKFTVELNATVIKEVVGKFIPQLQLQDRRQVGKIKFSGHCLIFTLVLSKMCGYHSACAIGRFWLENQNLLKKSLPSFPDIAVSHDTIKRTIENLVFEDFGTFIDNFALHVLFETLSDLHVTSALPDELVPFYKEVLLEYNQLKKNQEHYLIQHRGQGNHIYKATIFNSTFKGAQLREQDLLAFNQQEPLLSALRSLRLTGCCAKAKFVPKKYLHEYKEAVIEEQSTNSLNDNYQNSEKPQVRINHNQINPDTKVKNKFQVHPYLEAIALGRHFKEQ